MLDELFKQARYIIETIENHHHQAYFVGGCVRDLLLKRPIGDIDIATSASPEIIQTIFDKVIPVGVEHGTVVVVHENVTYEVTTFRVEGEYSDKRHPDSVTFIDQIDKDLERRDFTINALAMDADGNIIDLFEGKKDLEKRIIRTVGDGMERFQEDPLRIIRALRFSSQLGFQIDAKTLDQMQTLNHEISSLAVERIMREMEKFFSGNDIENGLEYLKITGSYKFLPVFHEKPSIIDKLPSSITPFMSFGEVIALFHMLDEDISISKWVKAWKASNQMKREATSIVQAIHYYLQNGLDRWLLYKLDSSYYRGFVRVLNTLWTGSVQLNKLERMAKTIPIQSRRNLSINGNDLICWFPDKRKGPWIQEMLTTIEKQVVFGNVKNHKSDIKEWIKNGIHPK
ncbi:CCA tRNA nucleotidyltransferase [Oceanobacillus senegalensis]|uniref:CCA tRNA nucleotidyltransferase n=1 Tax=Oceanobacillus senegalensis TaxID=1936063 RepID=UPI000A30A8B9|nr:CCA tRNA nucleotidyltransferase [Oceanobacillus senegalensis]